MSEISPDDLRDLLVENATLTEKLEAGEALERARAAMLTADEVSALVDRLLSSLNSQLPGMKVRDAELRLNVGFEKIGQDQGFVVPTSQAPPEARENLHSISLRFVREPE